MFVRVSGCPCRILRVLPGFQKYRSHQRYFHLHKTSDMRCKSCLADYQCTIPTGRVRRETHEGWVGVDDVARFVVARVLVRIGSNYENSPKASGFFLILKINSNLPKKFEIWMLWFYYFKVFYLIFKKERKEKKRKEKIKQGKRETKKDLFFTHEKEN